MMRSDQVRNLRRAGMQIGAHTVSHPILARLDEAQARDEIETGKGQLEDLLGERVTLFAYPNGKPGEDYRPDNVALVRAAGFRAAFSTAWGSAHRHTDVFQVPRFTPWDRSRLRFGLRMAHNLRRG
jgi:peptidoglycan/xylan/chitin deacetylase (PgdA/CDA1 family)